MHVYDTTHSKKGLRTEKVCVKGAPHLGELENVKPIRLANFGTPSWRSKPSSAQPMITIITKGVDGTYRHDVLGFVFN